MEIVRLADLQPRSVWDLIDDAFDLYRERFLALATLSATVQVPALLGDAALTTQAFSRMLEATRRDPNNPLPSFFVYLGAEMVGQPLLLLGETILGAGAACLVSQHLTGRRLTARRTWRQILPRVPALTVAAAGISLVWLLIACPSLGLGTFVLGAWTACVAPCLVLERRGVFAAFRRSAALAAGGFGRALGMTALLWGISLLLSIGVEGLVSLAFAALPGEMAGPGDTREMREYVASKTVAAVGQVLLAPLAAVAATLLYFDLRVRREGLDLEIRAAQSGVALAPDYFGGIAGGAPLPPDALSPEETSR